MTLDLQEWQDISSSERSDFCQALVEMLPGLSQHTCSKGYEGGFIQRLYDGTYLGHIIEHVALEISSLCGIGVNFGKTRYAGREGLYEIVTCFKNEYAMRECLRTAVRLVQALLVNKKYNLELARTEIKKIIEKTAMGTTTAALIEVLRQRGIPHRFLNEGSLIQLGYGKKCRRIQTAVTDKTSLIAADIAQDKNLTKKILKQNMLPVPHGIIIENEKEVENEEEIAEKIEIAIKTVASPFVVKPIDGNHGRGVSLNLKTSAEVTAAYHLAKEISDRVIIEEMCTGHDYRILVVGGKLIAAAQRISPTVIGDGEKTLQQLIDHLNSDPKRGSGHDKFLTLVEVDSIMEQYLKKIDLKLNDIIEKNRKVKLRENANLSSGGTAADVTDKVHPEVAKLCERAAKHIGLDICGIDLIHTDISLPPEAGVKIIEINAGPGLRMHISPTSGRGRAVAEKIVESIIPLPDNGRIPIVTVTGTNGKTTTVRLLHKIISCDDTCVGLTTTDGIWIGQEKIFAGDTTGPRSAQAVLSDPNVDLAVLEVARGGILRGGLGYDWSDVAVITNIKEDHIGQNGIEDVDDLVWIKSLTAERVKVGGVLVLNADDSTTLSIQSRPNVQKQMLDIFLFSISIENIHFLNHVAAGGSGCCLENGWIVLYRNTRVTRLIPVHEIPITHRGKALFNVANVLAATAAAVALGSSLQQIRQGLSQFSAVQANLGRFNIYKIRNSYVVLDYGHNKDAFSAVGDYLSNIQGYTKKVVLSLPGDRRDDLIQHSAVSVASFCDEIFLRDDQDRRGRAPGEIPSMCQKIIRSTFPDRRTTIIPSGTEALKSIVDDLGEQEILVLFYDELSEVLSVILNYDPQPLDYIPAVGQSDLEHAQFLREYFEESTYVRPF